MKNKKILKEESIKDDNKKESKMAKIQKRSTYRYQWGDLDLMSAGIVLLGVYLTTIDYSFGWILAVVGVLKQFSGK